MSAAELAAFTSRSNRPAQAAKPKSKDERDALLAARQEDRFAPMPELAYNVRLRQLYHESAAEPAS